MAGPGCKLARRPRWQVASRPALLPGMAAVLPTLLLLLTPFAAPRHGGEAWLGAGGGARPRRQGMGGGAARGARAGAGGSTAAFPAFLPGEAMHAIEEPAAVSMARALREVAVAVPSSVCSQPIRTSYYLSEGLPATVPVLVLLHGFDSSCLEWRRLVPALEANGIAACAVDVLGWGFTERPRDVPCDFSASAKLQHLEAFLEAVLGEREGRPVVLLGTSLGAAFAIALSLQRPSLVDGVVAMSPQVFVDGIGPMAALPEPVARLGVGVLASEPLRSLANWLSYADPQTFATEDAMRIGRLSVLTEGWADSTVAYMRSGGIAVSERVRDLGLPTLCVLARKDGIVEPGPVAARFTEELAGRGASLAVEWVDECGHVPHLERPAETAKLLVEWLQKQPVAA
mmetsp:Transcript_11951/g.32834  ORF Transcript_11951/g.32834 Transcript_11951/m.32834 type:complete len:400 (-) Transcript_11951:94-1293(-)